MKDIVPVDDPVGQGFCTKEDIDKLYHPKIWIVMEVIVFPRDKESIKNCRMQNIEKRVNKSLPNTKVLIE